MSDATLQAIASALKQAPPVVAGRCGDCDHWRGDARFPGRRSCGLRGGPRHAETTAAEDGCAGHRHVPVDIRPALDQLREDQQTREEPAEVVALREQEEATATLESGAGAILEETAPAKRKGKKKDEKPTVFAGGIEPFRPGQPLERGGPVTAIGVTGDQFHYLDALGQLRSLAAKHHGRLEISSLFGGNNEYLAARWPAINQHGRVTGPKFENAAAALMQAAWSRGLFDPTQKVRGRGVWRDDEGRLVCHLGDRLLVQGVGRALPLGVLGDHVYPAGDRLPGPVFDAEDELTPGGYLVELFRRWNWHRPAVDPILLVGWIGAGFLGAALHWRPHVFLTGDRATGKSTLQKAMRALFGAWVYGTGDTSPAGITGALKADCRPVAVDEIEADADTKRPEEIIKLARIAASGDQKHRGTSDQGVQVMTLRSAMAFSAINPPAMGTQDLTRFAILKLRPLADDAERMVLDYPRLARLGGEALGRLLRFSAFEERFAKVSAVLQSAGHGGRAQDTFGVLITCAEALIGEDAERLGLPFGARIGEWAEMMKAETLDELSDARANWRRCLDVLVTTPVEAWRSLQRSTIASVLDGWRETNDGKLTGDHAWDTGKTNRVLAQAGTKLVEKDGAWWLFVPRQHALVQRVFWQTEFYGRIGSGGWRNALEQAPEGVVLGGDNKTRVGGKMERGSLVALGACLDDETGTADTAAAPEPEAPVGEDRGETPWL